MRSSRLLTAVALIAGVFVLSAFNDYSKPDNDGGAKPKGPLSGSSQHWYHPPDDEPQPEEPSQKPAGVPAISQCGTEYPLLVISTSAVNCQDPTSPTWPADPVNHFYYLIRASSCTSTECPEPDYRYTQFYKGCEKNVGTVEIKGVIFCAKKKHTHTMEEDFFKELYVKNRDDIDTAKGYRTQVVYDVSRSTATSLHYTTFLQCDTTHYFELTYHERSLPSCQYIATYEPFVRRAEVLAERSYISSASCRFCPKHTEILRKEWSCELVPYKNEKESWVTVTVDYMVHCGK